MNRINNSGLFLTSLMAFTIAAPLYAGDTAATAPEATQATATQAPEQKTGQNTAVQEKSAATRAATTPVVALASEQAKVPAFGWFQSLTNGLAAIRRFVLGDTEKVMNGAGDAVVKMGNAAVRVENAANEATAAIKEARSAVGSVADGARQLLANGLAATKLDGLMNDESVQTLKQHAPLIFGVTVIGAALFAAAWMFKAELQTLAGPVAAWIAKLGSTATPAAQ